MFLNLIPTTIIVQKMLPNQKQKVRAVLPKPKLMVYIGRSQKNFLNLNPTPKIAPKHPKSAKKATIVDELRFILFSYLIFNQLTTDES